MCIKNNVRFQLAFAFTLVVVALGCQRTWQLHIIDATDPKHPVMRVGDRPIFGEPGISFAYLYFSQVDSKGRLVKEMWSLENTKNTQLYIFTYGIVPKGYREQIPPEMLETDKYYTINGDNYFFLENTANGIVPHIYSPKIFYDEIVSR